MRLLKTLALAAAILLPGSMTAANYRFPEFPIGVYSANAESDSEFQLLKKSGVNYVHVYGSLDSDQEKMLNQAAKFGMKVMYNLNRKLVTQENGLETMRKTVRRYKNHPALGFWYLYDEPSLKSGITPEKLRPFYEMLKQETPQIPVAMAICWDETFDQYSDVLDIQMADIYPVRGQAFPHARLDMYSTFVASTRRLGKSVIGVPQLFSWQVWSSGKKQKAAMRYPNLTELRYFYFNSLAQGVSGVVGYSFYWARRTQEGVQWWNQTAAKVLNEVKDFTDLLVDPANPLSFKRSADASRLVSYWRGKDGNEYMMMINCWPEPAENPGCYLEDKLPGRYRLVPWNFTRQGEATLENHSLKFKGTIQPWEVLVWKMTAVAE